MREKPHMHRERGQTLVIVALVLTTLMLMVGLVTDIGVAYNTRRDMQNAADAAALAGAWKFCDQNKADEATKTLARNEAMRVAQTLHGSDPDRTIVNTGYFTVSVTTATDSPLFFFRLIGLDSVPVTAEAEAVCGCANELGGGWPIAFDYPTYRDIGCGESLAIWSADVNLPFAGTDLCKVCDCSGLGVTTLVAFGAQDLVGPGDRGWLELSLPVVENCGGGASQLKTWLEDDYSGPIIIGNCVATKPGVSTSLLSSAATRVNQYVSVPLFDPARSGPTCPGAVTTGCSKDNTLLYVQGTGCVKVNLVDAKLSLGNLPSPTPPCPVDKKEKAIVVTKICDEALCPVSGIGSAGGQPAQGCILAASLVK